MVEEIRLEKKVDLEYTGIGENQYYLMNNGNVLEIIFGDEEAISPRVHKPHNSTFLTFETDYASPDETCGRNWNDILEQFGIDIPTLKLQDLKQKRFICNQLIDKAFEKNYILLPVFTQMKPFKVYTDSYTCLNCERIKHNDLVGVIYVDRDERDIFEIKHLLRIEIADYTDWINNQVYGFAVYDHNGDQIIRKTGYYRVLDMESHIGGIPVKDLNHYDDIESCLHDNSKLLADYRHKVRKELI